MGEQQQQKLKGLEAHNLPNKFIPILTWVKSFLAISRELCATMIEKHSDQFLEDVAWFCPYAFYVGFVPKSAVSQSTVVPQSIAMCVRPSCVRLSLKLWIRRQPHRQMLLPLVAPRLPLNQSKSLCCSTASAVLILSRQVHKDDVHARKVPDLLLDQAFAGSVTAGRFISAGKALFWQTSASLRKECRSSESPSKLTVFFELKLKGSRRPSYLKGVQTVPLSSRGTNLSWNNCTLSPLAGYLSAKTKMSSGLEGLGRPVAAGVLTDMAIVLQTIACVASAVPSLSTCRMVLPAMHKFKRKMAFSFSRRKMSFQQGTLHTAKEFRQCLCHQGAQICRGITAP